MTALDSEALFEERAKGFGVSDAVYQLLKTANYATFGKLAFCSSYQIGSNDEKPLMDALEGALGRAVAPDEAPALRRLYYEASTMVMSDLKSRVERTESSEPKKLPMAERANRLQAQKTRLQGVVMSLHTSW